jgi:hypothetical protein
MRRLSWIVVLCVMSAGCTVTRGSGVVASDQRDLVGFDEIEVSGSETVEVAIGSDWSVAVEADDNILPLVTTEVKGHTLEIGTKSANSYLTSNPVRISVTMPALSAVVVSGSGNLTTDGIGTASTLTVEVSGSGEVRCQGTGDRLDVSVSGSGGFDGRDFEVVRAGVEVSGSGSVFVWASDRLDASVSGSGEVRYVGEPGQLSTDVSGSGSINRYDR